MIKMKSVPLSALVAIVLASTSARASMVNLPAVDTSFAFRARHSPAALPDAVIDKIVDRRDEIPTTGKDTTSDVGFRLPTEGQLDPNTYGPPLLSMKGLCSAAAAVARANELPIPFFANLIWQESRFNSTIVSRAGALGIAQFMPETAIEYDLGNPFEPIQALFSAGRLLRKLSGRLGNLGLAAAAYNAGPRRVLAWMTKRHALPIETRRFVLAITGHSIDRWAGPAANTDPEMVLMPATAPCIEVLEAAQEQARILRISQLMEKLIEAAVQPEVYEIEAMTQSNQAASPVLTHTCAPDAYSDSRRWLGNMCEHERETFRICAGQMTGSLLHAKLESGGQCNEVDGCGQLSGLQ
jgi:hypothetical protein